MTETMQMRAPRFVRDERGAVALEFALVIPFMMLVVFGIIDMSRIYYTLNEMSSAVREGARYAAVLEDPAAGEADVKRVVRSMAYTFGGDTLTDADVTLDFNGAIVTVRARYVFKPVTPLLDLVNLAELPIERQAVFRWERLDPAVAPW